MTLYLIGIGLCDEKDISLKGLEAVKKCERVYLESYTSLLAVPKARLEKFYKKKITEADREVVEKKAEETVLKEAKKSDVAFLVIGDPFSATTHLDLVMRAKKKRVRVEIIHNASILNAVGEIGLELYKYGKTTSVPFPEQGFRPETPYNVIKENKKLGLHTLVLLDLRPNEGRFMSVAEALAYLTSIEGKRQEKVLTPDTKVVGCARIGCPGSRVWWGPAKKVIKKSFGRPPHCLIVPGKLHFMEEEALERFS